MTGTTTFEIGGAQLTVETAELFRAWFERHLTKPVSQTIAIPAARPGERYVTSIRMPDGRMRHTFLLPGDESVPNWNAGMDLANERGGDLPDRIEQAALYAFMSDEFQKEAYWSNTQHAGYSDDAWYQDFDSGAQYDFFKSAELRVRFVRREFSDSVTQ